MNLSPRNLTMRERRKRKLGPWELSHRTYSLRVPPELRDRIEALRKEKPLQEVLLKGLFLVECEKRAYEYGVKDGLKRGEKRGYDRGASESVGKFRLPCPTCGEPITFDVERYPAQRDVAKEAFKTWKHPECL